jgi:hypothetical protein
MRSKWMVRVGMAVLVLGLAFSVADATPKKRVCNPVRAMETYIIQSQAEAVGGDSVEVWLRNYYPVPVTVNVIVEAQTEGGEQVVGYYPVSVNPYGRDFVVVPFEDQLSYVRRVIVVVQGGAIFI